MTRATNLITKWPEQLELHGTKWPEQLELHGEPEQLELHGDVTKWLTLSDQSS